MICPAKAIGSCGWMTCSCKETVSGYSSGYSSRLIFSVGVPSIGGMLPKALAIILLSTLAATAADVVHRFKKVQITDKFWAEGATYGDFNHDGIVDVASGPFWYEGPDFKKRHDFYPANKTFTLKKPDGTQETIPGYEGALGVNNAYSDTFLTFTYDFNGDGWDDILIYGFPGKDASWYENPKGREGHWQRHFILGVADNESPGFMDINGDGKPDLLCC